MASNERLNQLSYLGVQDKLADVHVVGVLVVDQGDPLTRAGDPVRYLKEQDLVLKFMMCLSGP